MSLLKDVFAEYYGPSPRSRYCNMGYIIDIRESEWEVDGVGGASISGELLNTDNQVLGYYCCDACFWDPEQRTDCYENEICGYRNRYE